MIADLVLLIVERSTIYGGGSVADLKAPSELMNTIGGGGQHPLRSTIGHSTEDDSHLPSALPVPPIKIIPATPSSESRRDSVSLFGNHKNQNNHNHGQNGNSSGNNGKNSRISKINLLPSSGGKEKKLERIEEKAALAAAPSQGSMSDLERDKEKDTSTSRKVQQMLKNRVHKGHVTISTISKKFGHGVVRTKSGNLRRSNSAPGSSPEF